MSKKLGTTNGGGQAAGKPRIDGKMIDNPSPK
jgi:hypothetical protein